MWELPKPVIYCRKEQHSWPSKSLKNEKESSYLEVESEKINLKNQILKQKIDSNNQKFFFIF